MKNITRVICIALFLALIILPLCDARRLSKETYERKNNLDKKHDAPGSPTPFVEAYDDLKEHKEWKNKHHDDHDNFKGHHKFKHHFNLTTYFVEDNLPPNVYVVLEDKGIQVKAAYERMENSSTLTKVGIQVHNNYIVVSANGNLAVDGKEFNLKEIESIPLENGEMIRKHRSLIVKYDVYRIIMKVRGQHKDKRNKRDKDNKNNKNKEEKKEHKKSHKLPRVSVIIGVEKNAVVKPTGFIGERIAVDPTKYTSAQAI